VPWLLLLACAQVPDAPDPSSPSAILATRTGTVGRRAAELSVELKELEGAFDQVKLAPPEERERLVQDIRTRASAARVKAIQLRDEVADIEAAAEVY
jgi:hypothetical protein